MVLLCALHQTNKVASKWETIGEMERTDEEEAIAIEQYFVVSFVMIVCLILIFFPFCSSVSTHWFWLTDERTVVHQCLRSNLLSCMRLTFKYDEITTTTEATAVLFIIVNWLVTFFLVYFHRAHDRRQQTKRRHSQQWRIKFHSPG